MRVIRDNKELQGVKGVCKGSRGSQENTRGYYTYTEGYSWLKGAITSGYRELQVGFIYLGIILFYFTFYLQNVYFFNFSVLSETVIKY